MQKKKIKQVILESGYYSNFCDIDIIARNGQVNLDRFLDTCLMYSKYKQMLSKLPPHLRNEVNSIILFDPIFENGNPHTHGRYIFLPYNYAAKFRDIDTLIKHEAMHIWQRYHPCEATKYAIETFNCPITGIQKNSEVRYRSNPDINRILYGDITNEYMPNATSLNDIKDPRDHPYEIMAYRDMMPGMYAP